MESDPNRKLNLGGKHLANQDRIIENKDKARVMAEKEDPFREVAKGVEEKGSRAYGVEFDPKYIKEIGELSAESAGAIYDYRQEALDKTTVDLMRDYHSFTDELLSCTDEMLALQKKQPHEKDSLGQPREVVERQRIARVVGKLDAVMDEIRRRIDYGAQIN
jgi:hypothetical protein